MQEFLAPLAIHRLVLRRQARRPIPRRVEGLVDGLIVVRGRLVELFQEVQVPQRAARLHQVLHLAIQRASRHGAPRMPAPRGYNRVAPGWPGRALRPGVPQARAMCLAARDAWRNILRPAGSMNLGSFALGKGLFPS